MASVLRRLRRNPGEEIRRSPDFFTFNGQPFPLELFPAGSMQGSKVEASNANFEQAVRTIHQRSAPVASAVEARARIMSELVFKWRPFREDGRLFGTDALRPLEQPGPDLTRQALLTRVEADVAYHGNFYARLLRDGRVRRLRPDWVTILIGSDEQPDDVATAPDAEVVGYMYQPGGRHSGKPGRFFGPSEVAHWAPEPHPLSNFIGEAWVSAVYRDVAADLQATNHTSQFFSNAATPNMVALAPPAVVTTEQFDEWVGAFDRAHRGAANAWKTIYAQAGTDIQVVGSQLGSLDLGGLQGGFETRVAARSRVPVIVLQFREGMSGSALNSGNYQATRRMWADSWFSPYAQGFCASMQRILQVPAGAELTFDRSKILFLQEDEKDAADIRAADAITVRNLVDAGYGPDAVVEYVRNGGDLSRLLGAHSGLFSVQLQEAGAAPGAPSTPAPQE